jgi:hypothetical protein
MHKAMVVPLGKFEDAETSDTAGSHADSLSPQANR